MDMEIKIYHKDKISANRKVRKGEGRMESYYITVTSGMRGYFAVMNGMGRTVQ